MRAILEPDPTWQRFILYKENEEKHHSGDTVLILTLVLKHLDVRPTHEVHPPWGNLKVVHNPNFKIIK